MKKNIEEDLEKYISLRKGLGNHLCTMLLTDILRYTKTVQKDNDGNVNVDFTAFDEMVAGIKDVIKSFDKSENSTLDMLQHDVAITIEQIEKMKLECDIAARTLTWVASLCTEMEFESEEKKDA